LRSGKCSLVNQGLDETLVPYPFGRIAERLPAPELRRIATEYTYPDVELEPEIGEDDFGPVFNLFGEKKWLPGPDSNRRPFD
jgi:hypothetical protein